MINKVNSVLAGATLGALNKATVPPAFVEMLLVVFFVIALTYSLKILEFMIFKLKI
jgi:VIT1/CCC1 family predicted Fe2+/Mn2+ transporter